MKDRPPNLQCSEKDYQAYVFCVKLEQINKILQQYSTKYENLITHFPLEQRIVQRFPYFNIPEGVLRS